MGGRSLGRGVEVSRGALRYVVVRRVDRGAASDPAVARVLDADAGRWAIEAMLDGAREDAVLGPICLRLLGAPPGAPIAERSSRMRDAVLEAVSRGALVVLEMRLRRVVMPVEHFEAPVLGPPDPTSWIEVELCDAAGNPFVDEPYEIVTGDGRVRSGTLDHDGRAREDGIDPDDCKVTFPRIHEWKAA
jgi:hypothetical protein